MNARLVKDPGSSDPLPKEELPEVLKTLARNVRIARTDAGLNQRQLADRAGVTQSMVWAVEDKYRNINVKTLAALARALGKTEAQLLTPMPEASED